MVEWDRGSEYAPSGGLLVRSRRAEQNKSRCKLAPDTIGIVDFLAILPLWAFTGFDLRALRAFRLFRLVVTTAKLASRTSAVAKLARAFRFAMDEAGALFAGTCPWIAPPRPRHLTPALLPTWACQDQSAGTGWSSTRETLPSGISWTSGRLAIR